MILDRTQWQDFIKPGARNNLAALVLSLILWLAFPLPAGSEEFTSDSLLFSYIAVWLNGSPLLSSLLDWGCYLVMTFMLLRMNETYSFIHVRTMLPTLLAIIIGGLLCTPHFFTVGTLLALLLICTIRFAFKMPDSNQPLQAFNIGFFIGLSTLFYPVTLAYIVVFLYFYYDFNVLHLRNVLATLTGLAIPLLYAGIFQLCIGQTELFPHLINTHLHLQPWMQGFDVPRMVYMAFLLLVLCLSLLHASRTLTTDALRVRRMFTFFIVLMVFTLGLISFSSRGYRSLLKPLILFCSIVMGRYYSLAVPQKKIADFAFLMLMISTVSYFLYLLAAGC